MSVTTAPRSTITGAGPTPTSHAVSPAATTRGAIRRLKLPNGITLPYVEQGDRSGVPVLLLHGYTDSWRSFEGTLAHLPPWVRAFAVTQRGHGDADRPPEGYGPRDFAADLAAFMEVLGLKSAVIVGHSMGSYIAQRFALDHPQRTLGLVLMASSKAVQGNPAVSELSHSVAKLVDPIDPAFVLEFQQSTLAQPVAQTLLETCVQESLKVPARVWRAAVEGMLEADHWKDLGRIRAPTLIMWGDRDCMFPRRDQDALAAAIPGSRLVVYPGGGHGLHWEEPDRVAADLVAFAKRSRAERLRHIPPEFHSQAVAMHGVGYHAEPH